MSFNTPNARGGSFLDDDDPLFSSAIMDTTTRNITASARTPTARLRTIDPPSSASALQTPSNPPPFRSSLRSSAYRNPATPGLSASVRRSMAATTPHARAAFRTLDQRRAAALTPGGKKRRESIRPRRESLHGVLGQLSRLVKHGTEPIPSSSSPSDGGRDGTTSRLPIRNRRSMYDDDDDDDELPIDRPELTLPLDADDDDDLVPPRLSDMNDENATIEFPRRQEQPSRYSMGGERLSEFRGPVDFGADDDDDEGGFDPGFADFDEDGRERQRSLDRIEEDVARRETLASARESDFGFQVPTDADQTTFMMAVEGQSSPARPLPEMTDEQPSLRIEPLPAPVDFDDMGPAYDLRSSSPEDYGPPQHDDVMDLAGADADATAEEEEDATAHAEQRPRKTSKKGLKLSKYGTEYPSLPPAVVKRLAGTFAKGSGITKTKISPEVMEELQRASDWFFEQLGDDLAAYAKHAKRKTIDESDMLTLMRRQRQTNSTTTPFSLAQRHLPRELLQEMRMPKPPKVAQPKKKRRVTRDGEEEVT
ncbi:hypothetical protein CkaCkLH20_10344 [Colletotrichum karsti]|uniref:CENP-T/Histone H4 histone fold domain-containing protein n=1 Tax=Colletotrichum karsti TaxID=1095194 RepID=A0A9P6LH76_9PEZI|nr:uncharacterized protein CkaCkLH20_10344 [Colletotrichum karsti]KAF9872252.1 hypothetical protein CkaCkLH20_10344 [Colletotrichum karsti]